MDETLRDVATRAQLDEKDVTYVKELLKKTLGLVGCAVGSTDGRSCLTD